ncbi:metallo-dependent hydrolase [Oscillospiraceae bacterium]|uniref:amidohydrolase family protein n=1 Tax=Allofournierella sp. TaxID=1940256 RepID=UPI0015B0924F|nr:metallo-dependent hydrolase [Oscillospiraceae bacterium]
MTKIDLLIQNGRVVDPARGLDAVADIAIINNRIVDLPAEYEAAHVVDAAGCYVFPGLIDFHCHLFRAGSGVSVRPDYLLATGVTAAVDAGTAGCSNFEAFYASTVVPSQVRIKSYINMYGTGQSDYNIMDRFRVEDYRPQAIARMVDRYRDNILGLKIRMSEGVAENMEALDATIALAGELGVGVCVHVSKPLVPLNEIADRLRPGDIFCHVYQNVGIDNIFEADTGKVKQSIWKARERGVILDAANGKMNFNITCCKEAVAQGLWPDVVASDWLSDKYNYSPYTKNLMFILTKYLELGMPLQQALATVTATPARLMGMEGRIGTLAAGAYADVAIFKRVEKTVRHLDFDGTPFETHQLFIPQMVLSDGEFAFCQADFALV